MEIDIEIDSLTDCLIVRKSGEKVDTEYRLFAKTITKELSEKMQKDG